MKLCMGCMNQIEDDRNTCPYCGFNEITLRQESYYLDPGTIVGGKYIVGKVLSYGGYTISYLGMDAEKEKKVIVKEYLPSDFSTRSEGEKEITIYSGDAQEQFEEGLTNFLNEANRIQQLGETEGIATVYDCVAENDTGYVVSEYLEGQTLKEILDSGKKYSAAEAKRFISKILKGLCKVHPLDIIHCDISPETIMVTNSGEIKLLDFGATRYVTTANSKSLAIILKQGYAPEEQYRSRGVRGPWTDVYALAAVMYRMITGIVPQESVERALSDELKAPSKLGVKIPENGENALLNALNVYQEDRTPSAEAFLNELNSKKVERIKTKKKRGESGKFPKWAKALVACLVCVVIAGGALLFKLSNSDSGDVNSKAIVMDDLTGDTVKEAEKRISTINENDKIDLQFVVGNTVFDASAENDGKIINQSIPASTDFTDYKKLKNLVKKEEIDDLEIKEGVVKGKIVCDIYSNKKIRYEEMRGLNAYSLAKKLGKDEVEKYLTKAVSDRSGKKSYFDLSRILLKDGSSISEGALNTDGTVEISKIKGLEYYKANFYYWKKLPAFKGKNINTYKKLCKVYAYKKNDEAKRYDTKKTVTLKQTNLYNDSYISFAQAKGTVVAQTVAAGSTYDSSKGSEDKLLRVIGKNIQYSGDSGKTVAKRIRKIMGKNVTIEYIGSGLSTQKVLSVNVLNADGKEIKYFKQDDKITIQLEMAKKKNKIAPKVNRSNREKKVVPSSDGNYYKKPSNNTGNNHDV